MIKKISSYLPKNLYLNLTFLGLVIIYYIINSINFPLHDFSNYYYGAKLIVEGKFSTNIYFPEWFNLEILNQGLTNNFSSFAPNTPFLALLFIPFTLFEPFEAKLIFQVVSAGVFILTLIRINKILKIDCRLYLLIPILFFIPIRNEILFGQVYFLLFYLITETFLAWYQEKKTKAVIFLSVAILFKLFPIYFLAMFLFQKEWKLFFMTCLSLFILLFFSFLIVDWKIWHFYLMEVFPKASKGEIASSFVDNYQSVGMFLKRLFVYHESENLEPLFNYEPLYIALNSSFKIGLLIIGYFYSKATTNKLSVFVFWILLSFVISPYGSTYSMILLLFTLFWAKKEQAKIFVVTLILLLITCNVPSNILVLYPFPLSYLRMFFMLALFAFFLMKNINFKQLLIPFLVSSIVFLGILLFPQKSTTHSKQKLPAIGPMLITDLNISEEKMEYHFFDQFGLHKAISDEQYNSIKKLDIIDRQIWYNNHQLTNDKSFKKNAWLINDDMVVYLSDYQRGIGFFTLRFIMV